VKTAMSNFYLDTSALLKRYVEEKGTWRASKIWPVFDLTGTALIIEQRWERLWPRRNG
jgi:predicted nucleic acid-binding protein